MRTLPLSITICDAIVIEVWRGTRVVPPLGRGGGRKRWREREGKDSRKQQLKEVPTFNCYSRL